jgi:hypothetical protein
MTTTMLANLTADAANLMNGRHDCLPTKPALIGWTARQLQLRHPRFSELEAVTESDGRACPAGALGIRRTGTER